jgi:hypothetical protein
VPEEPELPEEPEVPDVPDVPPPTIKEASMYVPPLAEFIT